MSFSTKIIGVGASGARAVSQMSSGASSGVEYIAFGAEDDLMGLHPSVRACVVSSEHAAASFAAQASVRNALQGANLVVVVAGLGGHTGTGFAPFVASGAKFVGAMAVAVVTLPFLYEGPRRRRNADDGVSRLKACADSVICIESDRLLSRADKHQTPSEAFRAVNEVVANAVRVLINTAGEGDDMLSVGELRALFASCETGAVGIGISTDCGGKVCSAVDAAVYSPLLGAKLRGAQSVILAISSAKRATEGELLIARCMILSACDRDDADVVLISTVDASAGAHAKAVVIAVPSERAQSVVTLPVNSSYSPMLSMSLRLTEPVGVGARAARQVAKRSIKMAVAPEQVSPVLGGSTLDIPGFLSRLSAQKAQGRHVYAG